MHDTRTGQVSATDRTPVVRLAVYAEPEKQTWVDRAIGVLACIASFVVVGISVGIILWWAFKNTVREE